MLVSLAVPAVAFFWLSFTVPESPGWLVRNGRSDEARRALAQSANPAEVDGILAELAAASPGANAARPLLAFGARVVVLGVALSVLQQLVGLNAISYYGPHILQRMGYHMDAAFLGVLIARSLNLLATMIVVLIVDRVGRKPLLISGALVMGLAMMAIGLVFDSGHPGIAGLAAMCCYLTGLGMSFGPIVWIMLSEIFPASIRARAMSTAVAAQWTTNFAVAATFPVLFGGASEPTIGRGGFAFFLYGTFALLAAWVVLRHVPETKGVGDERLESFWRRQAGPAAATVAA
jgi:SP family xylose:H+ symportor-like MFS transporter